MLTRDIIYLVKLRVQYTKGSLYRVLAKPFWGKTEEIDFGS